MPNIRTFFTRFRKDPRSKARDLTMRQVFSVRKTRLFPSWKQWKQLPRLLTEKESLLLIGAGITTSVSIAVGGLYYVTSNQIEVPAIGGEYTEGLVGEPQFINPLYSISSDVDHDLTSLIYSGLVRWDATDGFVPDLAESIHLSEDGTVYTFKIRDNAVFHNGDPVRARDVVFTINAIQNPAYRSPLADRFHQVSIVQDDDTTVSFILEKPFAPFIQYLSVGIMPATLWSEILPQNTPLTALNLQPIGSGPYKFDEFTKDKRGSIRSYTLKRNHDFYLEAPYIDTLTFKFYPDLLALHDALENKNVEGASVVGYDQRTTLLDNKSIELIEPLLPQQTILYFNQSTNKALADAVVRTAIMQAIEKTSLVTDLYGSKAQIIHSPILPGFIGHDETRVDLYDPDASRTALEDAGYAITEGNDIRLLKKSLRSEAEETSTEEEPISSAHRLHFTLTTVDRSDMKLVAERIQANLRSIGISTELNVVPSELFATTVVQPRTFELLLATTHTEADPDPYMFWHSSQTKDLGMNLAGYSNSKVDTLLQEARAVVDTEVRAQKYKEFQTLLAQDIPAVFLYQATYSYAISKRIHHPELPAIILPSDRFGQITKWYIKTKRSLP